MKKILTLILALTVALAVSSCADNHSADVPENNGELSAEEKTPDNAEEDSVKEDVPEAEIKPEQPADEKEEENITASPEVSALKEISYESFKELIGYSMAPYTVAADAEKNMTHAVAGYNGTVELTYFSFVTKGDASRYFEEVKAAIPGDTVETLEKDDYQLCKKEDGKYTYLMVRIGSTVIFGNSNDGYKPLWDWFYGLGYVAK